MGEMRPAIPSPVGQLSATRREAALANGETLSLAGSSEARALLVCYLKR